MAATSERSSGLLLLVFTVSFVFLSLGGILVSLCTANDFPACCLEYGSPCYFGLLIPTTVPVFVVFMYCNWLGHKFFVHN